MMRCTCGPDRMKWDCPIGHANWAHRIGIARGLTRDELTYLVDASQQTTCICMRPSPTNERLRCFALTGHEGPCDPHLRHIEDAMRERYVLPKAPPEPIPMLPIREILASLASSPKRSREELMRELEEANRMLRNWGDRKS